MFEKLKKAVKGWMQKNGARYRLHSTCLLPGKESEKGKTNNNDLDRDELEERGRAFLNGFLTGVSAGDSRQVINIEPADIESLDRANTEPRGHNIGELKEGLKWTGR